MNINWNEKPEWAEVWIEDLHPNCGYDGSGWATKVGDEWHLEHTTWHKSSTNMIIHYPPEWNSEGIPPVGTVCEYAVGDSDTWFKCEIINTEKPVIYCPHLEDEDDNGLHFVTRKIKYRPIKSDREKWVDESLGILLKNPSAMPREYIAMLYDALISGELPVPQQEK